MEANESARGRRDEFPTETRRYPRYEIDALVDVNAEDEVLLYHRIRNISLGGLCIESPRIESVGTVVDLVLNLPDGGTIELRGEVVWASREAPIDMGIRYLDLDDEKRAQLRSLLNRGRR